MKLITLNISKTESLPVEFLSLRTVIYGGSGAGKTAFGRVIFEEGTRACIPCGVIDLKAGWWGLKSSANGNADGLPVIIFGGDHADVPIHENGGAELAEIVAELRQSFIIDLEHFSKTKQLKFLAPFLDRLYDKNRHPLKLICDEADRYIPQRIFNTGTKENFAAMCLGAGEDIAKRGRKHGIFSMFISQRNADLNKGVAELCEVAVIFRTSGPNDQKAVEGWFLAKGSLITAEQRIAAMDIIAALETGQAIVCCAHPHLKIFKTVQMRLPDTFDSSATPEIGKELLAPRKFARIELDQLGERMRATIEKAKENDPAELKRQVAGLKKELAKKLEVISAKCEPPKEVIKELPILVHTELHHIKIVIDEFREQKKSFETLEPIVLRIEQEISKFTEITGRNKNHFTVPALPQRARGLKPVVDSNHRAPVLRRPVPPVSSNGNGSEVSGGLKRMMIALAQRPGLNKRQLGVRAGLSSTSGTFGTYLGKLRTLELIEGRGELRAAKEFFE